MRYELLWRFGGIWVDADFECLKPIDDLLDGMECFAAWEEEGKWVNNAIMGCVPGHPFLAALIEGLAANVKAHIGWKPNRMSGPQYVTQIWRKCGEGVTVFPKRYFYPYTWAELERGSEAFDGAYAIHHWANRRRERGISPP